jgi:hypothetical protein
MVEWFKSKGNSLRLLESLLADFVETFAPFTATNTLVCKAINRPATGKTIAEGVVASLLGAFVGLGPYGAILTGAGTGVLLCVFRP